jgi:hypothetical protein
VSKEPPLGSACTVLGLETAQKLSEGKSIRDKWGVKGSSLKRLVLWRLQFTSLARES